MYGIIYKITNKINGKVYIGQTTQKLEYRWSQHGKDPNCCLIYNAINKYGKESFTIEQIDSADGQIELNTKEQSWIIFYKSTDRCLGYNISNGGSKGKHSEETKLKLSIGKLGAKNPQYDKTPSKETLEKRSKSLTGKKRSEETLKKQSLNNTQRLEVYCFQTGQTYHSIKEAARQLKVCSGHISGVLKGKRSHTGGYTFKYV